MRVLLFGSGSPASLIALQVLNRYTTIAGVVVPARRKARFWQPSPAAPLVELARREGLSVFPFDANEQQSLVDDLAHAEAHPDLICVATFPSILRQEVLQVADRGGINVHWSLLPKHRGPDPLFWTYIHDDRTTGVTLHWLAERADTGPILLQREIPLARGRPVIDVYRELAAIGGELFASAISLISAGRPPRVPQDEQRASQESSRASGNWQVDAAHWPAERVWHVVRGLTIGGGSLLKDARGVPLTHGPARGYFTARYDRPPGTIERAGDGWRVFCADGYVDVDPPPRGRLQSLLARAINLLRRRNR
ncbi:MAG TPA: formyltransferase family protein [Thermoanaerobaculia bacterium]|nr:formyltransferase family protein [Thermoanaerobaculia bacterium]